MLYDGVCMERALYQKHRPKTFADVVEQGQVVSVLEKSAAGDVAHAYLFTGPRGTGKTSAARIFAREIGCKDIDIFEIDAASHTGVENIRDITLSVYTQPVESKYKVYILDEVHMLSKAAFNAFLKTLEEPPSYAVFILVTTELEKVPETIISRCLALQFQQPSVTILQNIVGSVAEKEGYTLVSQSAGLIALMAEGSFRDALTLLQKVLFVADGKQVSHEKVEEVLGAPKHQIVNDYITALSNGDVEKGVECLNEISQSGVSIPLFAKLCIKKVRSGLLLRAGVANILGEYTEDDQNYLKDISQKETITLTLLKNLIETSHDISRSYIKVLPLECLLLDNGRSEKKG